MKKSPLNAFKLCFNKFHPSKHKTKKNEKTTHQEKRNEDSLIGSNVEDTYQLEKEATKLMSKLPNDIVLDILSRLTIKSLTQCRLVCKSWLKSIGSSRFTKLHFNRKILALTLNNKTHKNMASILLLQPSLNPYLPCDLYLLEYENLNNCVNKKIKDKKISSVIIDDLDVTFVKTQFNRRISELEIVGSCYGLLCLADPIDNLPIYVVNPITGTHVILPVPDHFKRAPIRVSPLIVPGFGYDHVKDEFKVVMISHWPNLLERQTLCLTAQVCTIGSDTWRNIGNVGYSLRGRTSPVFVNEALHWIMDACWDLNGYELIVRFDIEKEEFRALPAPQEYKNGENTTMISIEKLDIVVLGGCISLTDKRFRDQIVIWVMKEYGVGESWIKQFVVEIPVVGLDWLYVKPLSLIENEKILIFGDNQALVLYDVVKKRSKFLIIRGISRYFNSYVHVGSLVSPS